MKESINSITDLDHQEKALLVMDYFHRTMMHHAMWYAEAERQLGREKAQEALKSVYEKTTAIQMKRLGKTLGFEMKEGVPGPLLDLPAETMDKLLESAAINWLANDGVWFQSVEFTQGMDLAKSCNDACWANFSPIEAWSIKQYLGLGERSGLEGLKKALQFRLYASINEQSFSDETDSSFVFRMNDCRVQSARKRKGLLDYPCKSAGVVEYTTFAESIDARIKTTCIGCPPDPHPEEWYCSWRFSIED